jgi:hypothetical protein
MLCKAGVHRLLYRRKCGFELVIPLQYVPFRRRSAGHFRLRRIQSGPCAALGDHDGPCLHLASTGVISVRTRCYTGRYRSSEQAKAMSSIARWRLERLRLLLELSDLSIPNHSFFHPGVLGTSSIPSLFPDSDFALGR